MKNDIYLLGNHIPRPNIGYRVFADTLVSFSAGCQLAIKGNNGDDEFRDFDLTPIIATNNPVYGIINPYKIGFWSV